MACFSTDNSQYYIILNILVTQLLDGFYQIIHVYFLDQIVKRLISQIENMHSTEKVSPQRVKVIFSVISIFRWFKFTLKPPYTITHGNFLSAIWGTSHWTSFVKFGLKTA